MNRQKALLQIMGAVLVAALLLLVSAPRVAKSQGVQPVEVENSSGDPIYTQPISQIPSQVIGLVCREDGEAKTLSCEPLPFNPTSDASFTAYSVPSVGFLMVTEVEIHDGNDITASLTCSPNSSESYGIWEASGPTTAQYGIPGGIPLPPGCVPTVTLSKALTGMQVFLRGYLNPGLTG